MIEPTTIHSNEAQTEYLSAQEGRILESVPTPSTKTFYRRQFRRNANAGRLQLGGPTLPPHPIPQLIGPRVLEWKQDPFVGEIGIRKAFLTTFALTGPQDARITTVGLPPVSSNAFGDFIQTPGTDAFDAVHTFAVVRQTLTMFRRLLGTTVPWQWNSGTVTDPIQVFPHAGETMNAFYSRSERALKFFFFDKPGAPAPAPIIFTCRSLDIVAHETGHAVLDGLKPGWITSGTPQTGALHESFGDLTAMFVALSQLDQVEALIAQCKANLHDKNFLADLAEEFGNALGRPNGLRNADNDLKLSEVGTEVHDLSQVFTGGIYDVLADIFAFEGNFFAAKDPAFTLYSVAQYLCGLLLRAIKAAPATNATFADVVNQMLVLANSDGKPVSYRNFIRNRFTLREVVVSPTPLTKNMVGTAKLKAALADHPSFDRDAVGSRRGCCGTMRSPEFNLVEEAFSEELKELKKVAAARK